MLPQDKSFGISRRDALKLMLATGGWLAGGKLFAATREAIMLERPIPSSGETIPAVGLGTARTFDVNSQPEREPLKEVLRLFVKQGGRVVDSSPMYGAAEDVVGDLSTQLGINNQLFLATKVWTSGREAGIHQMQRSMKRLRTDRLDLMQVHNLVDTETHLDTLQQWKDKGRVRYIGITHYTTRAYPELMRWLERYSLDFVQFNYNILEREAENRLLPLAADRGTAVLVNEPFETGALFSRVSGHELPAWAAEFDCRSWAQFFLKYILSHPAVTCVIPATSDPEHLIDNMQAGYGRLPDQQMRQRMAQHIQQL